MLLGFHQLHDRKHPYTDMWVLSLFIDAYMTVFDIIWKLGYNDLKNKRHGRLEINILCGR